MISRRELANAIRILSIDSIEESKSGHPGAPMGMADIAEVLWRCFLRHNPNNPKWFDRDRFVLSNGHGSILLYSILHLTGYDLSIEDLKKFRKLDSKTPGHPESFQTIGVETTTGPLGQGLAAAVGMAIAERTLSANFNKKGFNIVDHYTWVFVGDGCLMEGISHEVCSLAGTLQLGKLIVFYDRNNISIDGNVDSWFTDNTRKRFSAYNWHVVDSVDGHNSDSIFNAIVLAKSEKNRPSIIICDTTIGFGSPNKSGKEICHGSPLGTLEVELTRKKLNWENTNSFEISNDIYKKWDATKRGARLEEDWNNLINSYKKKYPFLYDEYIRRMKGIIPINFINSINKFIISTTSNTEKVATRKSSQNTLEIIGPLLPELFGGSADLSPSNLTMWSGSKSIKKFSTGNYIHFGVREFGMTAIGNGISNHGGFIPYTSTFLIFVEYAKNAVRMAALMKIKHIFIYTHDSIGLGEDGPTHQPIEQITSLRIVPNLSVWRPCGALETAIAWKYALNRSDGPTALILSRQDITNHSINESKIKDIIRGGYILAKTRKKKTIDLILIATGSEVELSYKVFLKLEQLGFSVQMVSMPCCDVFDNQDEEYKRSVILPNVVQRVVIEAGVSNFWYKYIGIHGICFGIDKFGESGSAECLFSKFGFTVENIVKKINNLYIVSSI
ncbi:Transketolase 2 [Buchnera aphidicola (Tetraneura ulmi)]|uniref:transketolase n=1 Tax=Buchnera aphidicola TaxID=9 RepID=UPI003463E5E4